MFVTTIGVCDSGIKNVKIESKKIEARCVPYFFSTITPTTKKRKIKKVKKVTACS